MMFSGLQYVSIMTIRIRRVKMINTQILSYLNISINLTYIQIE